jgi:hypothetical protein
MAEDKTFMPNALRPWIEARRRFRLLHAHVQMARELGLNPQKLGKLDNHRQEPWKAPLPAFIENLYFKRFGKRMPDHVRSIEEIAAAQRAKKQARKGAKSANTAVGAESENPMPYRTSPITLPD